MTGYITDFFWQYRINKLFYCLNMRSRIKLYNLALKEECINEYKPKDEIND